MSPAPDATAALRQLTDTLSRTADPVQAARLIEQVTGPQGTLDALSDFLGTASRWAGASPTVAHLREPLSRACQDVYEAGAGLDTVVADMRAVKARSVRVRTPAARPGGAVVPAPPAIHLATVAPSHRR
ncbi:hypothetical protein ACFC26_14940 [Kitasatospora purpeofusca]|uniref:hypothetical protein n=1 Tax=Kitasatospora purpeofusca TaxID=67352 RepID=UPI0035E2E2C7